MSASSPNALFGFGVGLLLGFALVSRRPASRLEEEDDPELLLVRAQQEMREAQAKNRERAVTAITQKNNLQNLVEQTQKTISNLWVKAEKARRVGDNLLADHLLAEKRQYEQTLTEVTNGLRKAEETTEAIKAAMRDEEERIRAKTAQALALKAQWKQTQIETAIHEARLGITRPNPDSLFRRAEARMTQERERQKQRELLEQLHQTVKNLSQEVGKARENGDNALAERLSVERDTLSRFLTRNP